MNIGIGKTEPIIGIGSMRKSKNLRDSNFTDSHAYWLGYFRTFVDNL